MPHLKSLPANATAFDVFAAFPETYAPFAEFCQQVFRGPGPLPPRDRELIFAFCSRLNECKYCFGGHSASAHKLGVAEGVFDALMSDIDTAHIDAKLRPLLRLARKLNEAPSRMTQADTDACSAAGWDDAAIHQAIALCCLANYMNRLVEACGIPADPALFARRAELAVAHGYAEPLRRKLAEKGRASI